VIIAPHQHICPDKLRCARRTTGIAILATAPDAHSNEVSLYEIYHEGSVWQAPADDLLEADVSYDGVAMHIDGASQELERTTSSLTADILEEEQKLDAEQLTNTKGGLKNWSQATKAELIAEVKNLHKSHAKQCGIYREQFASVSAKSKLLAAEIAVLKNAKSAEVSYHPPTLHHPPTPHY